MAADPTLLTIIVSAVPIKEESSCSTMMGISSFLNSKLLYKCCVLSRINKILFSTLRCYFSTIFFNGKGVIRLPKAETAEDIKKLDVLITEIEEKHAIEIGAVKIVASIETALGVVNSYKIASASKRMLAIGLGAEDFRTDMRMERSEDASEILFARNLISLNAHAAGNYGPGRTIF